MKSIATLLAILSLTQPLAACGEQDDANANSPDSPDGGDADASPVDLQVPHIVSTSPADGDLGQLADVEFVIVFSEAMDQASVEGTLDAGDLGPVELNWNSAGDTLTLTPETPLEYAEGTGDPAGIAARLYSVIVGSAATDLAGNPMGDGIAVRFSTLKNIGLVVEANADMSRVETPESFLFTTDDPFVIGDRQGNVIEEGMRSTMTFDISVVPSGAHSITSAVLATRQLLGDLQGAPFTDLGSAVLLDHVSFSNLGGPNAAFNASQEAHATVGDFFVEGQVVVQVLVTDQLEDDLVNRVARGNLSQFLARFATLTDLDGINDRAVFSRDLLELSLTYLHP